MPSTYSDLKIELIATGEQSGTWGTTTNNNFSVAFQEAITGSADVTFSSADVTVTLTNTNAAQTARNLRLNLVGTSGGARNLILGSGCQIEKLYLINNTLADAVTVKNTTGTGITVPAGKTMFVYNNGTNVVDAVTHLSSLTLGAALPIASGGTGSTSTTFVNLASNVTGALPFSNLAQGTALSVLGVTGNATADNASIAAGTDHQVLRRSGTSVAFGAVNLAQSAAVTGTLPVGNGGTGATSLTANNVLLGNGTSALQVVAPGTAGNVLTSNGTTWTSAAGSSLTTPVAVIGNNTAGSEIRLPEDTDNGSNYVAIKAPDSITSNRTVTLPDADINFTTGLPIANGGTGATTNTAARTNLGASTLGSNIFTITNPSAVTFPRFNADNTVSALSAADFRTAIGAGSGGGTVTSVSGTGTVNGISLSGTVTSSGSLTLGGTLSNVSLTTQITGTLPVGNGGTGATTLTSNNVILGNGGSAVQFVAPGASGNVLTSNGTTWTSAAPAGGTPSVSTFTSSGTWTKPSGVNFVRVEIWGAGGGGGGGYGAASGGGNGGDGGSYTTYTFAASSLSATETVTIGAGGTGGSRGVNNPGSAGTTGGITQFKNLIAGGGAGGGGTGNVSTQASFGDSVGAIGGDNTTKAGKGAAIAGSGGGAGGAQNGTGGAGGSPTTFPSGGGGAGGTAGVTGSNGVTLGFGGGGGGGSNGTGADGGVGGRAGGGGGGGSGGSGSPGGFGAAGGGGYAIVTSW